MKILEMIFLGLTIIVPLLFVLLGLVKYDKVKRSKKVRKTLVKMILLSLIINGCVFGAIKMYNIKQEDNQKNKEELPNKNDDKEETPSDDDEEESREENTPPVNNEVTDKPKPPTNENTDKPKPPVNEGVEDLGKTSKGYKIEKKNGVIYIDGYLMVNKTYPLPESYVPSNTHKNITAAICQECIINEAYDAYIKMRNDASSNGLTLWIASGYRSYTYQNGLYQSYVKRSGQQAADTYSARPGHSEHQSGYSFDLNSVTDAFANTKEGKWVAENCYKYGFIIRFPKGKDNETGYKYEPWHLRYVGTDLASKLYNNGDWITMEDYFGITSAYSS